mmetsp:Transcript_99519/g.306942  ORF Transcript_99519/g.306942 Transcript_99519/m.306942 type:complete len:257 (+) Transcript_99519:664-1434(+)
MSLRHGRRPQGRAEGEPLPELLEVLRAHRLLHLGGRGGGRGAGRGNLARCGAGSDQVLTQPASRGALDHAAQQRGRVRGAHVAERPADVPDLDGIALGARDHLAEDRVPRADQIQRRQAVPKGARIRGVAGHAGGEGVLVNSLTEGPVHIHRPNQPALAVRVVDVQFHPIPPRAAPHLVLGGELQLDLSHKQGVVRNLEGKEIPLTPRPFGIAVGVLALVIAQFRIISDDGDFPPPCTFGGIHVAWISHGGHGAGP